MASWEDHWIQWRLVPDNVTEIQIWNKYTGEEAKVFLGTRVPVGFSVLITAHSLLIEGIYRAIFTHVDKNQTIHNFLPLNFNNNINPLHLILSFSFSLLVCCAVICVFFSCCTPKELCKELQCCHLNLEVKDLKAQMEHVLSLVSLQDQRYKETEK